MGNPARERVSGLIAQGQHIQGQRPGSLHRPFDLSRREPARLEGTVSLVSWLGFVVWFSRWPGISHLLEFGDQVFAKNRLKLTGRCATGTCDLPNSK